MAKRSAIDELDDAVDALMAEPHAPLPRMDPRLAALLRIAADLRDLPSEAFKARLRAELLSEVREGGAPPSAGRPLVTEEDIRARLQELAGEPGMVAHDLGAALGDLPEMTMRFLASLNRCTLGVTRFSEPSHWERHPAGDELLHVLEGEAGVGRGPAAPALVAHDLRAALSGLLELAIASSTTAEEAAAAVRPIASLDQCTLGVMRYSGLTPWERHPDGDELLHPLEGEVDVTLLTDSGPTHVTVRAGSVFVCPRGLWHRQLPRPAVTMFFGTPTENAEVSWAEI